MSDPTIQIAANVRLPIEAVTETFAILGKRGSGKTQTARRMAEQMLAAGSPIVFLDPVDVAWGLRSSADGAGAGQPIAILGGEHADVPLEPTAGSLVADLVVDETVSAVLSLRHMSEAEKRRFVADFAERLYERKGRSDQRTPLHLFIDEADEFVPQRLHRGSERMFGAIDRIVRRGRASGLGVTLISQRPQVINKDVLTQCQVLVAHRLTHQLDRRAVGQWVEAHDSDDRGGEVLGTLASLAVGEAWIWDAGWIGIFERVRVLLAETYDSSATPKRGEVRTEPKRLAEIDVEALRERMAETIERAAAEDPAVLRKRIAGLERELAAERSRPAAVDGGDAELVSRLEAAIVERDQALERQQRRLFEVAERLASMRRVALDAYEALSEISGQTSAIRDELKGLHDTFFGLTEAPELEAPSPVERTRAVTVQPSRHPGRSPEAVAARVRPGGGGTSGLSKAERSILTVLAQYPQGRTMTQVAVLAGYASSGGGFRNALGSLRSREAITGSNQDLLRATPSGLAELGAFEPLPAGRDLRSYWLGRLSKAESAALEALCEHHPSRLSADEVAMLTGYQASGGGFRNALGKLRTLELIEGGNASMRASDSLFVESGVAA
jgi:hypothetical protein